MTVSTYQIAADADDGHAEGLDAASPPPVSGSSSTSGTIIVARSTFGLYLVRVGLFGWDTSPLSGATVSVAKLRIYLNGITNTDGLSLTAEWHDWGATVDNGDYTSTAASSAGSWALSGLTDNAWNELTLTTPGTVNTSGYTRLRLHISSGALTGTNYVTIHAYGNGSGNKPELVLTHTDPSVAKNHSVGGGIDATIVSSVAVLRASAVAGDIGAAITNSVVAFTAHAVAGGIDGAIVSSVTALTGHALAAGVAATPSSSVDVLRSSAVAGQVGVSVANSVTATTTITMPFDRITDHVARALDRLASQFK